VLQPTPLQEPVADLGFEWGGASAEGTVIKAMQAPRGMGSGRGTAPPTMGMAGAVPLPRIFFKILVLEIAYYGTF